MYYIYCKFYHNEFFFCKLLQENDQMCNLDEAHFVWDAKSKVFLWL